MSRFAVVTGAANGIGRAISSTLAHDATVSRVFAVDRDSDAGASLERENPGKVTFLKADLGLAESCRDAVAQIANATSGKIDILCNNVGIQSTETSLPLHELSDDLWKETMNINLNSYFWMSKHSLPLMRSRGGVIVNMSSVQGFQSQKGIPHYAASKGAILSLTRQMAIEYASWGVRVVSVCPGTIRTKLVEGLLADAGKDFDDIVHDDLVFGGVGMPQHVADVVHFLCGDGAAYISGEAITVDGGIMAKGSWNT